MTNPTAAVLLIGDELLSGRTRDINLQQVAQYLEPLGIPVMECRTVPDILNLRALLVCRLPTSSSRCWPIKLAPARVLSRHVRRA